MATRKTTAERIADTKEKIGQYEKRMKLLLNRQKEADRKARTHRLVERGAILESLIGKADTLTNEQVKLFLEKTVQTEYARKVLNRRSRPRPNPQGRRREQPLLRRRPGAAARGKRASPPFPL